MRFTRVEPNRYLEFEPVNRLVRFFMPRLSFDIRPTGKASCQFEAKIHLRVGPNAARLNAREFNAVRKHMRQEGENLKRLVEAATVESSGEVASWPA